MASLRTLRGSRKKKASVKPAPDYAGTAELHATVAKAQSKLAPGAKPILWDVLMVKMHLDDWPETER
jgi:hypothetical protein